MKALTKGLIVAALWVLPMGCAWAAPIEDVQIQLHSAKGTLPVSLATRMRASLATVGQRLLVGKDTEAVSAHQQQYEAVAKDIASRVFYGYEVQRLGIHVGPQSTLSVTIAPYGDLIEHVEMQFDFGNLSPYGKSLVEESLAPIKPQLDQLLLGIPLDSVDWATAIMNTVISERLHELLPDFSVQVRVVPGKTATVKIYLIPQGDVIRQTNVMIQSDTLPTSIFYGIKKEYMRYMQNLQGLPVGYVLAIKPKIEAQLQERLRERRGATTFQIQYKPTMVVGATSILTIDANSNAYRLNGEGRIDVGRQENTVSFFAHGGYLLSPRQELYVESEFYPGKVQWKWYTGYAYRLGQDTQLAYQYEWNHKKQSLWWKQQLGPQWYFKVLYHLKDKKTEYALNYDWTDYVSIQLIGEESKPWLRLIGHI